MKTKRFWALLLMLTMLLGMMPTAAFAAGNTPITTDKVYTYQKIDSVDDIVPGKHFIIVAEYTNETTGETSYHALGAKMAFYDGFAMPIGRTMTSITVSATHLRSAPIRIPSRPIITTQITNIIMQTTTAKMNRNTASSDCVLSRTI